MCKVHRDSCYAAYDAQKLTRISLHYITLRVEVCFFVPIALHTDTTHNDHAVSQSKTGVYSYCFVKHFPKLYVRRVVDRLERL